MNVCLSFLRVKQSVWYSQTCTAGTDQLAKGSCWDLWWLQPVARESASSSLFFLPYLFLQQPLPGQGPGQCMCWLWSNSSTWKSIAIQSSQDQEWHLIPTKHWIISTSRALTCVPLHRELCHCTGSCATQCRGTKGARTLLEPGTALTPRTDRWLTHRNPQQH